MAFSDVKISYYQSMFRIRSRRFLVFAVVIQIACVLPSTGAAQVASSQIQDQVQEHFLAAQQAQQQGRLDDAVAEYQGSRAAPARIARGVRESWAGLLRSGKIRAIPREALAIGGQAEARNARSEPLAGN